MHPVKLDFKQALYRAGGAIETVYFPNRGTASAITIMEDGRAIEVATIGRIAPNEVGNLSLGTRGIISVRYRNLQATKLV